MSADSDSSAGGEDSSNHVEKLYLQVPDVSHWVEINKEICTRWLVENEFVEQLRNDLVLQEVFETIIFQRPPYSGEMAVWFKSQLYTIRRAFSNRFDMACELIREAKRAQGINNDDERMLAIRDELGYFSTTTAIFKQVDAVFEVFSNKANTAKMEFTEWLAQPK